MPLNQTHRSLSDIGYDVRWGVNRVIPFVAVFGGMSLIGELIGVKFAGFNIERTIFFYGVFGLLTGLVVGLLRPIASTIWGAGVIGAVAGAPIGFYVLTLADGWGNWVPTEAVLLVVFMAICAFCAVGFRRGYARAEQRSSTDETLK